MDPQACLQRIADVLKRSEDNPRDPDIQDECWDEFDNAMEDLGLWLEKGGYPPIATGPIFGMTRYNVGDPAMGRTMAKVRTHVRTSNWKWAIMVKKADDLNQWVMVKYDLDGDTKRRWELAIK